MRIFVRKIPTAMLKHFPLIGLIILAGCAAKHQAQTKPDVVIPVAAITQPVILKGCDLRFSPPHCKTAIVTFSKGSEQIRATH